MEKNLAHTFFVLRMSSYTLCSIILIIYNIRFGQEIFTRKLHFFQVILSVTTLRRILKCTYIFSVYKNVQFHLIYLFKKENHSNPPQQAICPRDELE